MHSFQPSRGRIYFEVFCALTISGSCAGAWSQTGASAFLPAAAVSLLYGLIRMFDLAGLRPMATATEPQRVEFDPPVPVSEPTVVAVDPPLAAEAIVEEEPVQEPAPRASAGRRKGGSRKGSGRRAKGSDEANVVELVPAAEEPVAEVEPVEEFEPDSSEIVAFDEHPVLDDAEEHPVQDESEDRLFDDVPHAPVVPLFEPEPFARQQRVMFGRKSR